MVFQRQAMGKKRKRLDCVKMKDEIQARIRAEYEAHKDELPSFLDLVRARNRESEWVQQMRRKFGWDKDAE